MGQLTYTTQEVQDRLDAVGTFVRPNLLDNAYFVGGGSQQGGGQFPINQRGSTTWSGSDLDGAYSIDRWTCGRYRTGSKEVQLVSDGLVLSNEDTTPDAYIDFIQTVSCNVPAGTTVTYSALANGSLYSMTGTIGTTYHGQDFNGGVDSLYYRIDSNKNRPEVTLRHRYGANITVMAMKFELGDTQTLAHQDEFGNWVLNEVPNYQQELAKCQRYFVNLNMLSAGYPTVGGATAYNASTEYVVVNLPVPMRTQPTVSFVGNWYLQNGSTKKTITAMSADICTGSVSKIKCDSSGLTTGAHYVLEGEGTGNYIYLSADL